MEIMEYSVREKEVKQFVETKAGVKGLIDSGITKIPRIFIHRTEDSQNSPSDQNGHHVELPLIDLQGIDSERRKEIVNDVKRAAETWGFFQIVNHGIPLDVLDQVLKGVRQFHEQPQEYKKELYSVDFSQKAIYYSSASLKASVPAVWKDTLTCNLDENEQSFDALPHVCRKEIVEFFKGLVQVRDMLLEVLSEALGVRSDYLKSTGFFKSVLMSGHYYPFCPEPDLTMGVGKHSDFSFLTFVLQDKQGGLQILHQNHWVNVPPVKGALVANIGQFMQIISNGKFKSVEHRVLATRTLEPRISVASLFGAVCKAEVLLGPIKEVLSEENPPVFRETTYGEYVSHFRLNKKDRIPDSSFLKI